MAQIISFEQNRKEQGLVKRMEQYRQFKEQYPNATILFRCGDFYECYDRDAREVSRVLGITLTKRDEVYMAGFPHYALDIYLPKLIKAGYKVAIVDEYEDPKRLKKLAKTR